MPAQATAVIDVENKLEKEKDRERKITKKITGRKKNREKSQIVTRYGLERCVKIQSKLVLPS